MTATQQVHDEIDHRLEFHPGTDQTIPMHEATRARFIDLAHWLADTIPAGRHQSLALTALQEALMWSNAAIACDTLPEQPKPPELLPTDPPATFEQGGAGGG